MAFTENLDLFLADFGVAVSAGMIHGTGILDMPSQVVADGMVLTTDYTLTTKATEFGGLLYGDFVTVDGQGYQVREVRKLDDGQLCEIGLQLVGDLVASVFAPDVFVFGVFTA
jgi:hypothetical protein